MSCGFMCYASGRVDPTQFFYNMCLTFAAPPSLAELKAAVEERTATDNCVPDGSAYRVGDVEILDFRLGMWVTLESRRQLYSGCQLNIIRSLASSSAAGMADKAFRPPNERVLRFAHEAQLLFEGLDADDDGALRLPGFLKAYRADVDFAVEAFSALDTKVEGFVSYRDFLALSKEDALRPLFVEMQLRLATHGAPLTPPGSSSEEEAYYTFGGRKVGRYGKGGRKGNKEKRGRRRRERRGSSSSDNSSSSRSSSSSSSSGGSSSSTTDSEASYAAYKKFRRELKRRKRDKREAAKGGRAGAGGAFGLDSIAVSSGGGRPTFGGGTWDPASASMRSTDMAIVAAQQAAVAGQQRMGMGAASPAGGGGNGNAQQQQHWDAMSTHSSQPSRANSIRAALASVAAGKGARNAAGGRSPPLSRSASGRRGGLNSPTTGSGGHTSPVGSAAAIGGGVGSAGATGSLSPLSPMTVTSSHAASPPHGASGYGYGSPHSHQQHSNASPSSPSSPVDVRRAILNAAKERRQQQQKEAEAAKLQQALAAMGAAGGRTYSTGSGGGGGRFSPRGSGVGLTPTLAADGSSGAFVRRRSGGGGGASSPTGSGGGAAAAPATAATAAANANTTPFAGDEAQKQKALQVIAKLKAITRRRDDEQRSATPNSPMQQGGDAGHHRHSVAGGGAGGGGGSQYLSAVGSAADYQRSLTPTSNRANSSGNRSPLPVTSAPVASARRR